MGPEQNRERCERRQEEQHRHGERPAVAPALNTGKMPSTATSESMAISYCSAPMPMRSAQLDEHLNELLATKVGISQDGSARHRHHVIEVGHDPDRAGDDEKDDQHTEGKSQNIVRAIGPEADMKKEDEVDADLR